MTSVLAEFPAHVVLETTDVDGPSEGRVRLTEDELLLAPTTEEREAVALTAVFDVSVGTVPQIFDPLPGTPVTVAYRDEDTRVAATISTDEETTAKFTTVLFKVLLNGTTATIKHPAKVGGRVVDSAFRGGLLSLSAGAVEFETNEGPITVGLDGVIDFDRETRTIEGSERPVLSVSHMTNGEALTTLAATESNRKLSLLGRYIRTEYQQVVDSLRELELSEPETETLTTIYSTGGTDVSLGSILDEKPKRVKRILHALHRKGLIESGEGGPVLTAKGQIVVNEYLERVND
jgi:helix-turn-helix protein